MHNAIDIESMYVCTAFMLQQIYMMGRMYKCSRTKNAAEFTPEQMCCLLSQHKRIGRTMNGNNLKSGPVHLCTALAPRFRVLHFCARHVIYTQVYGIVLCALLPMLPLFHCCCSVAVAKL